MYAQAGEVSRRDFRFRRKGSSYYPYGCGWATALTFMYALSPSFWPILPGQPSLLFHGVALNSAFQLVLGRPDVRDGQREGLWVFSSPFLA
jgi:hypothetical protein